jgi:hypothetical protein
MSVEAHALVEAPIWAAPMNGGIRGYSAAGFDLRPIFSALRTFCDDGGVLTGSVVEKTRTACI